ncbi:MAG: extracellular solute-binding protein [Oscillospiraceae bacterium]
MKKQLAFLTAAVLSGTTFAMSGCKDKDTVTAENPVTLTMWHNFGGELQTTIDSLLEEFNSTVGKEKGIIINVTAISSSAELQTKLDSVLNGDPGAPAMPDIFTAYPKTAVKFQEKDKLANLDNYFTADELSQYVKSYVDEGRFNDGLYVFPFAKSTEVLFVNKTLFDRFSADSGITEDDLATFNGIADAAVKYYNWTDAKTPDVKNDGKTFFTADSWLNLTQAALLQQGTQLFDNEQLNLSQDQFSALWNIIYPAAAQGGFAVYDGYSSDLSKTGDIVCSVGSTAGITFYGDTITYPDNTTESVSFEVLPYPTVAGGKKVAIQRGNGLCVAKSTPEKEQAAAEFLRWFTDTTQNLKFVASTGYMPVKTVAYADGLKSEISGASNDKIKSMLEVSMMMHNDYESFVPPTFDTFDAAGSAFEKSMKAILKDGRTQFTGGGTLATLQSNALKTLLAG